MTDPTGEQLQVPEEWSAPEPAQDRAETLEMVLDHFKHHLLHTPPHQRDTDAWDLRKRQRYVERLKRAKTGSHPPGLIATYQVITNGNPGPVWLNDGLQRLTTLRQLQAEPDQFAMTEEGVRQLLRQTISVQHRLYESHAAAMEDFQRINDGTRLTPYELCRVYLRYMAQY